MSTTTSDTPSSGPEAGSIGHEFGTSKAVTSDSWLRRPRDPRSTSDTPSTIIMEDQLEYYDQAFCESQDFLDQAHAAHDAEVARKRATKTRGAKPTIATTLPPTLRLKTIPPEMLKVTISELFKRSHGHAAARKSEVIDF